MIKRKYFFSAKIKGGNGTIFVTNFIIKRKSWTSQSGGVLNQCMAEAERDALEVGVSGCIEVIAFNRI